MSPTAIAAEIGFGRRFPLIDADPWAAESGSFLLAVRDLPRQYSAGVMEDVHRTIGSLHRGGAKLQLDTTGLIAALTAVASTFRGDP